jgi:hypothetical protein
MERKKLSLNTGTEFLNTERSKNRIIKKFFIFFSTKTRKRNVPHGIIWQPEENTKIQNYAHTKLL